MEKRIRVADDGLSRRGLLVNWLRRSHRGAIGQNRPRRLIVFLLVGTLASAVAVLAPATPAFAASGHACAVGPAGAFTAYDRLDQEGVFCADITSNPAASGTANITFGAEGICQIEATSAIIRCANVDIHFALYDQAGTELASGSVVCGHNGTLCSKSGRNTGSVLHTIVLAGCEQVWTVVYESSSSIELPTTAAISTPNANIGSGHITVCPAT